MKGKVHAMPDNCRLRMVSYRGIRSVFLCVLILVVAAVTPSRAGVPLVSLIEVTDVTPASFTVSWQSSEPARGSLYLFKGDCVTPIANPVISSESSDRSGFIRVTVAGLTANTAYCYRTVTTSVNTSETTINPVLPTAVQTEKSITRTMVVNGKNVPFANDLLQSPTPYLPATAGGQDGLLIVLKMLDGKGNTPLSLLLTTSSSSSYFNMNNLFDPLTGQNINLTGGERVKITERHGNLGCAAIDRFRLVPVDTEITKENRFNSCFSPLDVDCSNRVTILDILRVAHGIGSTTGDMCFNSDLDVNSDGKVDQVDVDAVAGGFDATAP